MISRRRTLTLPVAMLLPSVLPSDLSNVARWPLWSALGCHDDLMVIGLLFREQSPEIRAMSVAALAARFAAFPGATGRPAPDQLRAALRAAFRMDFINGRVMEIDFWRVARTEAELSAFAALSLSRSGEIA